VTPWSSLRQVVGCRVRIGCGSLLVIRCRGISILHRGLVVGDQGLRPAHGRARVGSGRRRVRSLGLPVEGAPGFSCVALFAMEAE
jgi:hypothetical protein